MGLVAGAALAAVAALGLLDGLDALAFDMRYRLRGVRPAADAVALVEVDDATVRGYGRWPLPRNAYALLLDALGHAGARAVGMDLTFIGYSARDAVADELLTAVTRGRQDLVHSISFLPRTSGYGGDIEAPAASNPTLIRHGRPVSRQHIVNAAHVSMPFPELLAASEALGHTALAVDRDGVVRSLPLFVRYGDFAYPALALRLIEVASRRDPSLPQFEMAADGVRMHRAGRRTLVPRDRLGNTAFVFSGDERAFPHRLSMLQVLQWSAAGDTAALSRAVRGRLVLVGATSQGEATTDVGATPFSETTPLVYVHANAVAAALQGRFLTHSPRWALALVLLVLGAGLGALYARLGLAFSAAAAVIAGVMLVAGGFALFAWYDLDVPATALLLMPPLTWAGVEGLRRRVSEREALAHAKELDVARTIQRKLLPEGPPRFAGLDVWGLNLPAEAVGGDYYDWPVLEDGALAVVVGDVTGHGVPAALLMAHLRASLHAEASRAESPAAVVAAMNRVLARATDAGRGATFFLARFDPGGRSFRYCNAGHNPPFLVRGGSCRLLPASGIPIAVLEDWAWEETSVALEPGDVLVLYSDGVIDWEYRRKDFGEERWQAAVVERIARGGSARELAEALLEEPRRFARGAPPIDDVTLVVVKVLPGATTS